MCTYLQGTVNSQLICPSCSTRNQLPTLLVHDGVLAKSIHTPLRLREEIVAILIVLTVDLNAVPIGV